jgi:hypothetical protein
MSATPSDAERSEVVISPGQSYLGNMFWRSIGVRAVPHLPCRIDCADSLTLAERMLLVARQSGFANEADWTEEILSWPVEWSALHGIAEIKTPIMKIITRTDATAGKLVVQWQGVTYPAEGAIGVRFPYQPPVRPAITTRRAYQRGVQNNIMRPAQQRPWYYTDNGFCSLEAMERLHQPIVALAHRQVRGAKGKVLDLGCGNGALLAKICNINAALVPVGVDFNKKALEHARELLPVFKTNFIEGDLFDNQLWAGQSYVLTLLMIGRLLEAEESRARKLISSAIDVSTNLLIYVYPNGTARSLHAIADRLGINLGESCGELASLASCSSTS